MLKGKKFNAFALRLSCTKKYKFLHYVIYIPSTALAFILLLYLNFWQSYEKYWYMQKKAE